MFIMRPTGPPNRNKTPSTLNPWRHKALVAQKLEALNPAPKCKPQSPVQTRTLKPSTQNPSTTNLNPVVYQISLKLSTRRLRNAARRFYSHVVL